MLDIASWRPAKSFINVYDASSNPTKAYTVRNDAAVLFGPD